MKNYEENNYTENRPTADVLMSSMRSMGYSFESAVADIVDNSISAGASEVYIEFPFDPSDVYLAICDDGCGMDRDELRDAMRYGSSMKRGGRSEDDLGRFGLGLKAASLSQCRRLTVVSKKDGQLSACAWDMDVVEEKQDWIMVSFSQEQILSLRMPCFLDGRASGTVVLWEDFDFLRDGSGNEYEALQGKIADTDKYLSLIYHRYLNGKEGKKLRIRVCAVTLSGYDPFLEDHPKTTRLRAFTLPVKDRGGKERNVDVQPYVLPFQKDLSPDDEERSGGVGNYRTRQGFYIYRNRRLIVWGTWFRQKKDELTKYARIRVDIPNTLDEIWGIDIKKQQAKIPPSIQQRLTRAVEEAMGASKKKQRYRGRSTKKDERTDYVWDRRDDRGTITYSVNTGSRIFDLLRERVDDETWAIVEMLMEQVGNTLPLQDIYIDKSQNAITEELDDERKADIKALAEMLIPPPGTDGQQRRESVDRLMQSEPFSDWPELRQILLEAQQ